MSAARVFQELAALEAAVQGPAEAEWQRVHQQLANSPIFADNTCDRAASAESDPSGQHSHACGCALVKAEAVVGSAERTCALLLRAQTHFRLKVLPACIADAAAALSSCLNTTGAMLADFHPSDPGAGAEEEGAEGREVQLGTQTGMPLLCAAACTLAMACCSTRAWGEARDACVAAGQDLCALLKGDEEEVVKAKRHHMLMHHGCRCHRVRELREKCDEILSSAPAAGLAEGARIEQDVGGEGGDGEGEKETAGAHADKPRWKYPRTQHLCDPGGTAVSRDDLLMDPRDVQRLFFSGQRVLVEEKVDGANLGISLGPDGQFVVQNRGHFVTAATHAQFAGLPGWLEAHREMLVSILQGPGQWVLFGEWLYARHSLAYDRLPSYFLAFDLFHCPARRFLAHHQLRARLAGTGIPVVPQIAHRPFADMDDLLTLLNTPSRFYRGFVEGIYLRVEDPFPAPPPPTARRVAGKSEEESKEGEPWRQYVVTQAKIVRPDFVQGITSHWAGRTLERNRLAMG